MPIELVTVTTADGVELDGAFHAAAGGRPRGAVLMVHGLTWNFYRGPSRWLPPRLAEAGYACLSLNMRDHDLQEPKDFELSHHDIMAGVDHLAGLGPGEIAIVAHGYACNKVACYPGWSGDTRVRRSVLTTLGAVRKYRPDIWEQVLGQAPRLAGRVLIVQGAVDPLIEAAERAAELRAAAAGARTDVVLLAGGNHYFDGRHAELAACIVGWLGEADPAPARP
jgi:alpha-beta hydrolase superfamily lysophospholipase